MVDDFLFNFFFNAMYICIALVAGKYIVKYIFYMLGHKVSANAEQEVSKEVNGLFLKIKGVVPLANGMTVADKYRHNPDKFGNALWGEIVRIAQSNPRSHLYKNERGEQSKLFQSFYQQFEAVVAAAEKD